MVGKYWATGIVIAHRGPNEWTAWVDFYDDGFCNDVASEGTVRARYLGKLETLVDVVKADVEALGII